jgi:hypothetical protein
VADPKMSPPKIEIERKSEGKKKEEGSNKARPLEVKNCLNKNIYKKGVKKRE